MCADKVRLLIASADKAREMGIDWWAHDPHLSNNARRQQQKLSDERETRELRERVNELEAQLNELRDGQQAAPRRAPLPAAGNRRGRGE